VAKSARFAAKSWGLVLREQGGMRGLWPHPDRKDSSCPPSSLSTVSGSHREAGRADGAPREARTRGARATARPRSPFARAGKGVLRLPLAELRSALPVLRNPTNEYRTIELTPKQFRRAFTNAMSDEDAQAGHAGSIVVRAAGRRDPLVAGPRLLACVRGRGR
jgi:hypothetical protein